MRWEQIDGFMSPYRVSDEGVVQRWNGKDWITLQPYLAGKRVCVMFYYPDKKRKSVGVARLVAEAFMGGVKDDERIVHINRSKFDNAVENLRKVSKYQCGTMRDYTRKVVAKISPAGIVLKFYPTVKAAARDNYWSEKRISDHCHGRVKDPFRYGYSFRFDER